MKTKIALIAFGGNALLLETQRGLQEEQMKNAKKAARLIVQEQESGLHFRRKRCLKILYQSTI
jgi:carbamate kinase